MPYCCVKTCKNHSTKTNTDNPDVSYHKLPTDSDLKEQWIRATGRKLWNPPKNSTMCSEHFEDDCFVGSGSKRRIIDTAVPTINIADIDISDIDDSDDDDDDLTISQIKKSDDSDTENLEEYTKEQLITSLRQAREKMKRRRFEIKRVKQQLRRDRRKLLLQNKILNDLMEIYNLKPADIAILKAEIIKAEE